MNKLLTSEWVLGYLSAMAGWLMAFIIPISAFLLFTVFLVVCDLFTGTMAARHREETISSKGLRRTVEKIVLYFIAILASEGMSIVFMPKIPISYVTAFAIGITEFRSNIENIEAVTGVNIWKFIKDRLNPNK
jgi:phage-related holin